MEISNQIPKLEESTRFIPAVVVGYLEVLFGLRRPEQLARWLTDKFYGEMKYRAQRESIARQLTGIASRPSIRLVNIKIASSAQDSLEAAILVSISGKLVAIALSAKTKHGRQRVYSIDLLRSTF